DAESYGWEVERRLDWCCAAYAAFSTIYFTVYHDQWDIRVDARVLPLGAGLDAPAIQARLAEANAEVAGFQGVTPFQWEPFGLERVRDFLGFALFGYVTERGELGKVFWELSRPD